MSRPLSAMSNTGSSTQRKYNMEINPKTVNYQPDGSGRDTYVKIGNGGFFKDWNNNYNSKSTSKKIIKYIVKNSRPDSAKVFRPVPKVSHYKADGTGRDTYIKYCLYS